MENCILDIEKKIQIPQNEKIYFKIEKSNFKYSIDIKFDISKEINYINLFFIIKSFFYTNICKATLLKTSFINNNDKLIITQSENILNFKNISFEEFINWINFRIQNDWEYEIKSNLYSITILFDKKTVILRENIEKIEIMSNLKPNYFWSEDWLSFFEKSIEKLKLLEIKIEKQKKIENENEKLKKENEKLKKENKKLKYINFKKKKTWRL